MSRLIIDSHNHIINHREPVWGWGPRFTVEDLIATMDREYDVMGETRHVDKAVTMGSLGITTLGDYSMREAHQYAIESVKKFKDRIYLNTVYNPRIWNEEQLDQVDDWVSEFNLCMLKLHPTMHNYFLPLSPGP